MRQNRAAIIAERSKVLNPMQIEISSLEARIIELESQESSFGEKISEATRMQDAASIAELSIQIKKAKEEIDSCFKKLEEVSTEHDRLSAEFDARIADLK